MARSSRSDDSLWHALRDSIREHDLDAPDTLERYRPVADVWNDPALILSQTCGMPWRLGLYADTQLIGTPDYRIEGCPTGYYCSVIVVRADDTRGDRAAFSEATCAFNARNSQSGFAAWEGMQFGEWLETGAHTASVRAVASGEADIAAIDAVTWRLAQRYQSEASSLRVLERTAPTPGLPYITSKSQNAAALFDAVSTGIAALDAATRQTLSIEGLVLIPDEAYRAVE